MVHRTWAVLEYQPYQLLCHYDLVQSRNMRVYELAVVVNLAGEVGVVLLRRLENNLATISDAPYMLPRYIFSAYPGAIAEFVRC